MSSSDYGKNPATQASSQPLTVLDFFSDPRVSNGLQHPIRLSTIYLTYHVAMDCMRRDTLVSASDPDLLVGQAFDMVQNLPPKHQVALSEDDATWIESIRKNLQTFQTMTQSKSGQMTVASLYLGMLDHHWRQAALDALSVPFYTSPDPSLLANASRFGQDITPLREWIEQTEKGQNPAPTTALTSILKDFDEYLPILMKNFTKVQDSLELNAHGMRIASMRRGE